MKKARIGWMIIVIWAFVSLGSSGAADLQRVRLMLDWFPNPDHVPIYVAKEQGIFKQNGLDVEILIPADPNDPLKLTAAGKVEFGINYQPNVIIARSKGLPLISIGALIQHPLSTIMYLKGSGIKEIKDFKGKKIGYSVAPLYEVLFEAVAESSGLKRRDYDLIHVGFNLVPILLSGKVHAVVGAFRNYEKIQVELEGKKVGLFPLEENGVPDFYELIFISHEKMLKKDPKAVRNFMESIKKGIEITLQKPDKAFGIFLEAHSNLRDELNRRSFKATLPFFKGSPSQSVQRWEVMQDFMLSRGLIKKKTELKKLMTTKFSE